MAKLVKQKYYNKDGEAKVFSYFVTISKALIKEVGWTGDEQVKVYVKGNKLIVEKEG